MKGIIYALAEPSTHDIRYCGKTVMLMRDRMYQHRDAAYRYGRRHLCNWLRKVYDAGAQPQIIICEQVHLEGYTRREQLRHLNALERRWIEQLKALGFRLTNATKGGDGCHGRVVSAETKQKMSRALLGQKRSQKACESARRAALARPASSYRRGLEHQQFGKPQIWRDGEARARKIRQYWRQPEVRAAHSVRMKGTMSLE